jgi:hypothetical protein
LDVIISASKVRRNMLVSILKKSSRFGQVVFAFGMAFAASLGEGLAINVVLPRVEKYLKKKKKRDKKLVQENNTNPDCDINTEEEGPIEA